MKYYQFMFNNKHENSTWFKSFRAENEEEATRYAVNAARGNADSVKFTGWVESR